MIECETIINKKSFATIYKYYVKNHKRIPIVKTFMGLLGLILLAIGIPSLSVKFSFDESWDSFYILALIIIVLGIFSISYALFGAKRLSIHILSKPFLKKQAPEITYHYTFDQKGIHIKRPASDVFYQWSFLKKISEQADCYVVEVENDRFLLIAKSGFKDNGAAEFQNLLREVIQPRQWGKHQLLLS